MLGALAVGTSWGEKLRALRSGLRVGKGLGPEEGLTADLQVVLPCLDLGLHGPVEDDMERAVGAENQGKGAREALDGNEQREN